MFCTDSARKSSIGSSANIRIGRVRYFSNIILVSMIFSSAAA